MQILNVTLCNIGQYIEKNSLDLQVDGKKNIILIGGNNGSGKTTLLNALTYGLFGCHSMGLTTNTSMYYLEIEKLLNNNKIKKANSEFYIEIEFKRIENYKEKSYKIKRSWDASSRIKEKISLSVDSVMITSPKEIDDILSKLYSKMNHKFIFTSFFDGEKIGSLISEGEFPDYLKDVFYNTFNIDVSEELKEDIKKVIVKQKTNKKLSSQEIDFINQKEKVELREVNLKNQKKQLVKLELNVQKVEIEYDELLEQFKIIGGLTKKQLKEFVETTNALDLIRKNEGKEIKDFFENDFIFGYNKDLLKSVSNQLSLEAPVTLSNQLNETLKYINDKEISKTIKNTILTLSKNDIDLIHNEDVKLKDKIDNKLSSLIELKGIKFKLENNNSNSQQYNTIKSQIENYKNSDKLKEMLNNIEQSNNEIGKLKDQKDELSRDINDKESKLDNEKSYLYKIEDSIEDDRKEESSIFVAEKVMSTLDLYKEIQLENKVKQVSKMACNIFNSVNHKTDFINEIVIDPETFNVELKNNNGKLIKIGKLSAGESQIIIGAIVLAIVKISNRRVPFIYDTPLSRLDKENRIGFIKEIIANSGEQVIILSTDEEIVGNKLTVIENKINKKLLLKNNGKEKTKVLESYFE